MPLSLPRDPAVPNPGPSQYPVRNTQASATIDGKATSASSIFFADKIMMTITQDGRLAQWIQVPLTNPDPNFADQRIPSSNEDDLLPMTHLTPKTLLGVSTPEREMIGQLYATQIASAIIAKNPEEKRPLLLGLGLSHSHGVDAQREVLYDIIDLVTQCLAVMQGRQG